MTRRDHTLAAALCVSIVAHAALLMILVGRAMDAMAVSAKRQAAAAVRVEHSEPIYLVAPKAPPPELLFGDKDGKGDAANASPGDRPMVGLDGGEVQAFLSRDPVGAGHVGDDPSMSVLPRGGLSAAARVSPPPALAATPVPPPELAAIGFGLGREQLAMMITPLVQRHAPIAAAPPAPRSQVEAPAAQAPPLNEVETAFSAPGGSSAPPADPAIMSDSESDPFSRAGNSIEFLDGRVDVRFGRKVKTVRPRLSLSAKYDLLAMQFPRMVVRVHINAAGDVRLVDIVKSSGSPSADQEVKVTLYQWWIEPPKNPHGVAVADVVQFPITWR